MYTAIRKKPYICFADVTQAQRQTYIKRRYLTLCSQHIEIWPFQKAQLNNKATVMPACFVSMHAKGCAVYIYCVG